MLEADPRSAALQLLQQPARRFDGDVDEADPRLLMREPPHDGLAYAGAAAGYQDHLVLEIRINCAHDGGCCISPAPANPASPAVIPEPRRESQTDRLPGALPCAHR